MIQRVQRRQFVRVPQLLDVAVHPHKTAFEPFTSVTLDLSAGGILVLANQIPIEVKDELELTFILPTGDGVTHTVDVLAELVRVDPRETRYELAFQFTRINDRSRELVLRHCYQAQMKNSRRGTNPFT
ncbi:flagellar brake protein [Exiguobacterium artemiae]